MSTRPDTLPLDSDIVVEIDDSTFLPREERTAPVIAAGNPAACDTLPLDSDITIERDI